MIPCLPSQDPRPGARRAAIVRDRETYRIAHAYKSKVLPDGFALAEELPPQDAFGERFFHAAGPIDLRSSANSLAVQLIDVGGELMSHQHGHTFMSLLGLDRVMPSGHPFPRTKKALLGVTASFPADLSAYEHLFRLLPLPAIATVLDSSNEQQDRLFAWQRIAGANPLTLRVVKRIPPRDGIDTRLVESATDFLRRVTGSLEAIPDERPAPSSDLPSSFVVTDADVQKTLPRETLKSLADAGRLFICDYSFTHELPTGNYTDGILGITRQKRLYSPYALFAWKPADDLYPGHLVPLAIQCERDGIGAHVFTPKDGIHWKMAKTVVQQADSTTQELVSHLARTHLICEAAILSCRREMAPWHPVRVLMDAHGFNTLAINDFAAHHLIAPGGQVDELFAATLQGNLELAARGLAGFSFDELSPAGDAAARGFGNGDAVDNYPWRDDALLLWPIIERFARRYLHIYYGSDVDVAEDKELQGFVNTLRDPSGGAIASVPNVQTIERLAGFMARLMWTASLQHGCLNNSQFDYLGYAPAAPGALYAEAPDPKKNYAQSDWMKMLPPVSAALSQASLLYQLANVRIDQVGHFPEGTFVDPRVAEPLKKYQEELKWADGQIVERDRTRFLPYPYLRPSLAGNSVFI